MDSSNIKKTFMDKEKNIGVIFLCLLVLSAIGSFNSKIGVWTIIAISVAITCLVIKRKELSIIFLLLLNENLFYLISRPLAPIIAGFAIVFFIVKSNNIVRKKYIFKKEILLLVLVCFISEIGAMIQYGQSLLYGLFGMHYIFIYFLYFYFVDYFNDNDEALRENIKNIIIKLGTVMSFLYLIQALIYPKIIIFNMSYGERGGHVRFYTGFVLIMFSILFTYVKLLDKFNLKILGALFLQITSLIIVSQTRNFILAIFLVLVSGMFIYKKNNKIKITVMISVILSGIMYFLFFSDNNNTLNNLIGSLLIEGQQGSGNVGARINEINYYMSILKRNLISGMGILYSRFELTDYITGYKPYFYFVGDIGMIGYIVQTGLLGATWLVYFLISLFKQCKKNNEESSNLLKLTIILIIGLMGTTPLLIDKGSILYLSLMLAITENRT